MLPTFIWAKKEVTYGVDSVGAAANAILATDVQHQILGERTTLELANPGLGPSPGVVYGENAELSFKVPLTASGAAGTAPKWGPLPQAAGLSETLVATTSTTYAPRVDPSASDSLSLTYAIARRRHKLLGARGRQGVEFEAGKRPMLNYTFKGLHADVTTGAQPVQADATWTGWSLGNPVAQGRTTFSFNGVNVELRKLNLDPIDNVVFEDLPHSELVSLLGARGFKGSLFATLPLPSALNLETLWKAQTTIAGSVVHESVAGSIVTANFKAQIGEPKYSEVNGKDCFTVDLFPTPSALNLDDEFSLVLT